MFKLPGLRAGDAVDVPGARPTSAALDAGASVTSLSGGYSVDSDHLDTNLIPKRDVAVTNEYAHASGRGVAYTTSPFAYLFERVA